MWVSNIRELPQNATARDLKHLRCNLPLLLPENPYKRWKMNAPQSKKNLKPFTNNRSKRKNEKEGRKEESFPRNKVEAIVILAVLFLLFFYEKVVFFSFGFQTTTMNYIWGISLDATARDMKYLRCNLPLLLSKNNASQQQ